MISAEQLQEIKARCEATTPGPWCKDSGEALKVRAPHGGHVAILGNLIGQHGSGGREQPNTVIANADFIAHARTDIPSLIAEVERLQELVEALSLQVKTNRVYYEARECYPGGGIVVQNAAGMALKVDSRVVELEAKGVEDENTEA